VVEEVPFPGQGPNLNGLKETLRHFRHAFPDSQWHIEEQIGEGVIDLFEDGKVMSTRNLLDRLGLMQQLGVVPVVPQP
jgi:predicted ester cyclase